MYLIKNITNLIRKYTKLILERAFLIIILSIVFLNTGLEAEEKFVGFIESLEGKANKEEKEKIINLNEFDQIFVNQKITIDLNSSITISFIDNSVLTLGGDSEFIVEKFDNISKDPSFILSITKGKFTFESGTIAKNDNGIMKIKISEMEVNLKGTLVTGSNSKENKQISLVEDSMGKVGTLDITVDGSTTTLTEPSAGINLSENNEIQNTTLSDEETELIKTKVKEMAVNSATQSEEKIDRAISKQLALGTIPDANGDGIADASDIEAYKADLMNFKETKLEYFVSESGEDLSLMSEIIVNSNSNQSMQLMQGMMDNDTGNATLLMNEIMSGNGEKADFDIFSHIAGADAENFEALRETIVTGMIEDQSTFATDTMAQMMKVSDDATSSYLVYEITHIEPTETTGDEGTSLAMNVLASFTEIASEKMTELYQQDPTMIDMLTTSAFESATEEDIEMMSTMMQNSTGGNTAMLMQSMVEYNPEMVATVYEDLTSQDFDLFNHIETGRAERVVAREERKEERRLARQSEGMTEDTYMTEDPYMTEDDPYYEDLTYGDPAYGDPTMEFFDDLKGELFTEIVNNSEGTAAEITSELMMNTSGDNAMFMMEAVMYDNPELVGQVMGSFAEEEFDIFEHFEEIAPVETESFDTVEIDDSPDQERVKLTKEERKLAKAERKAERKLAKAERKAERKAARILAREEKKAAEELAELSGFMAEEDPFMTEDPYMTGDSYTTDDIYGMENFKAQIFTEMITYADENTMNTMAQIVSTSDAETSALVFESIIQQPSMTDTTTSMYGPETGGSMALEFLDSLNQMDSEAIGNMYEENSSLMGDVLESALSSATATDAGAVSGIISSSNNDAMNSMMFENISDSNDQSFMGEVFVYVATDAPEIIMAMAETNQDLYENLAQDVDSIMTAASLMTDIYNTENDNYTTAATDTTTTGVTTKTKRPKMMKPVTSNPYQIDTWMSGIYVYAESNPYTNGVTIDATGLPPGLYFNSWGDGGEISGTPTTKGNYQVFVTATDMLDPSKFRTRNFSIKIRKDVGSSSGSGLSWMTPGPIAPAILTKDTYISEIYLYTTGGTSPITYSDTNLPPGLYLTSFGSSYVISGAPTDTSPARIATITATDMNGSSSTTYIDFPAVGAASGSSVTWTTTSAMLTPGSLTENESITDISLSATGTGVISYSQMYLPMGLSISGSTISGAPTMVNNDTVQVIITATDDMNTSYYYMDDVTADLTATFPAVAAAGGSGPSWMAAGPSVSGTLTEDTAITSIYLSTYVTGGVGSLTFTSDDLPPGLQITAGSITGTPTGGTYPTAETTADIVVTDGMANTDTFTMTIPTIYAAAASGPSWMAAGPSVSGTLTEDTAITSIYLSTYVTGGVGSLTFTSDDLPPGLQITAGSITGTPTGGTYPTAETTADIVVTDGMANTDTFTMTIPTIYAAAASGPSWMAAGPSVSGTLTEDTAITSIYLSTYVTGGVGSLTFTSDDLPPGLQITAGSITGTPTGGTYPTAETTADIVVTDGMANTDTFTMTIPTIYAAAETFAFDTDADLGTKPGGVLFAAIPITATASQGTAFTYLFVSNDPTNFAITVTNGNDVSGIPPRLKIAASYQIAGQIKVGAVVKNTRTFTILVSASTPCLSPIANICS